VKATVEIYDNHHFYGDPCAKYTMDVLRVQSLDTRDGIERYVIGDRLQDSAGIDVTDYEHDNVWKFRMEVACMSLTMLTANWIEMVGVVIELQSWVYGPEDESQLMWEGLDECKHCTADEGEQRKHGMVEHYTPPKVNGVSGKWVKVRMLPE
jgi:hypothetical protein